MLVTTLNKIKAHSPCTSGWQKLLKSLGKTKADDEELSFLYILESNGLDDALWCCRSAPEYDMEWRSFALQCCRQIEHLMTDQRSKDCLDVVEKFLGGKATEEELNAASYAAWAAAWDAARAASWDAASDAASYAARAAARNAARAAQLIIFKQIVS